MSDEKFTNEDHWKVLVLVLKETAAMEKITPNAISNKIGVSASTVTRIFNLEFCPKLQLFIDIARAVGVNFFIESKNADTDLNNAFEKAMTQLGRRPDKLPKN